jgi:2-(1,2-epoxy-1,2-dihydrophenyl)acetyl-CoA isomerase
MNTPESILVETDNNVLKLTLNRPKVNALNTAMLTSLYQALRQAEQDQQVRCILITGQGNAFSAGQDISEFQQVDDLSLRAHLLRSYNPVILQLRRMEKPVLAAINGAVAGAALGLVLACDLRIAADNARFVVGFSGIGLAPDSGVSLLLPTIIGLGRASDATFNNQPISADQALHWGLVNRVVNGSELAVAAMTWASQIAQGPLRAMGLSKRLYNKAVLRDLEKILDYEAHIQEIAGKGAEHKEGVNAFLEKRAPDFTTILQ